jgi:16S rRNA (adenine1518-N6/adenine1519-N6)-dimethyltransferase
MGLLRRDPKKIPPSPADMVLKEQARQALAKKRFGQNFLTSSTTLNAIVRALELQPTDQVLEIGPGLGFLTELLLEKLDRLTAVELERDMVAHLKTRFADEPGLTVVAQDFLAFPLASLPTDRRVKIVGNIPYNITSKVLLKLTGALTDHEPPEETEARGRIDQVTLMVQKEVAQRIAAKPSTKAYSPLSIAVQQGYEPWIEFDVPPSAFHPRPGVMSAVVTLVPRTNALVVLADPVFFTRMVRTLFQQRRKTIKNTLPNAANVTVEVALQALAMAGIDSQLRPEALDIPTLGALANAFHTLSR